MATYYLKTGEYLTLNVSASDAANKAKNINSGYTFVSAVKRNLSDTDANAVSYIDSTNNSDRFSLSGHNLTAYVLTTAESNNASATTHYYAVWINETASSQAEPIDNGTIIFTESVPDTK